jgi:ribose-phosphate pyrophosphokinase
MTTSDIRLFDLGSNTAFAKKVAGHLGVELGKVTTKQFSDGEQYIQFQENLRGKSVFLMQSTNAPADNWVRLFLAIDAARGASAREITAVIPYFGYSRQDRKSKPREPISARVFAMTLEELGVDRILTMDLHNDAIGGFFRTINVDYLYARPVLVSHFKEVFKDAIANDTFVVVSPDAGGVVRAQSFARRIMENAELAIMHKEREQANKISSMKLVGDVKGKTALIVDDMADTCGTLVRAASLLMENGVKEVYAAATHGVLSGAANVNLDSSPIKTLYITDTVNVARPLSRKIEVVSVSELFANAINRMESGESLSALFEAE